MNEERLEAYLNVINALLNCPTGEEPQILNANQDLLDAGLLQAMAQVAEFLEKRGDRNAADFLIHIARQLAEALRLSLSTPTSSSMPNPKSQLDFLLQILQATADSNGNPRVMYPLLQANLDKLDDRFAEVLRDWANTTQLDTNSVIAIIIFSNLIQQFPLGSKASNMKIAITGYEVALRVFTRNNHSSTWAIIQNNLGEAYRNRIQGERADNLEQAIHFYQEALQVWTREAFPQYWADAQNNLAIAYTQRIRGERADNLEQAIHFYQGTLQVYTREVFPQYWAMTQNNLGEAYRNRIRGERANNLDQAIHCYQAALQVYTSEAFPQDWAMTQNNLASAYFERIRGERADNLEQAIHCYQEALQVLTREAFPQYWAQTQNNLASAYLTRIRGERANNLEQAIHCYEAALQVRTRESFPQDWAQTQNNLGNAYTQRIRGERADNLEQAIHCYQAALQIYTCESFPQDWAMTENNLASAYFERIRGERADNLEQAIHCYQEALQVRTRESFPQDWAQTQNNLGNAYLKRTRGERPDNLEQAIHCYQEALQVRTRESFPQGWAQTQNNLGHAYFERIREERPDNLEQAIHCYQAALQVRTRESFPQDWAQTQNNLGNAYLERIRGEKPDNLEQAIHCYQEALQVLTREAFPQYWADAQNNLGNAYLTRIRGEKADNREQAIQCYEAALKVRIREAFPQYYAETQWNLGLAYQAARQCPNAYNAFDAAIDTIESQRDEIVSGSGIEADKKKLAEEWNKLYQGMVKVCLELAKDEPQYYDQAIEYAERSKTRNLVELILSRDRNNIFPPEIVSQLEQLQDKIASGQYQIQTATADNPTGLAQHLQQLRQKRNELQDRYLPIGYGFKLDQFQATLNDHTTIIQWYITRAGFETFIITRHSLQRLTLSTPVDDLKALINWANEYLEAYTYKKTEWINSLASRLSRLAEILHLEDILKLVPDTCLRLILIPHRFLHLFPLHALPLTNGDFLCDRFPRGVGYAPSCQLLQLTQKRERPDFSNLFAIQNPTDDLLYTHLEVETISSSFPSAQVLVKQAATKTALNASQDLPLAHCNHFSCHGKFNLTSPLESALILANKERLTLGEIFGLTLNQCRLVTLSACETGLTDPTSISDEYIGLPSGFLYAGTATVVSSLWEVSDLSTAFLMLKFYENFQSSQKQAGDVAIALNQAQKWLRNLTIEEGEEFLEKIKPQIEEIFKGKPRSAKAFLTGCYKRINNSGPHPFAHPFDWAAFTATGF